MLPLFLIIIFSLFVYYSIRFMLKREHDLYALSFFSLYIYTIFAQIGYAYYPELSMFVGAYFGPNLFYKYWLFMFFSFVFSFLLYKKFNSKNDKRYVYSVRPVSRNYGIRSGTGEYFFFLIVILLYLTLNLYFFKNRELFGYGGGKTMGGPWFGIGFLVFQTCTFILFTLFRDKSNRINKRIFSFIIFILCLLFYLQISVAAGSRSHILYFFIACAIYELSPIINTIKYKKRKIFMLLVSGIVVLTFLSTLRTIRNQGTETSFSSIYNFDGSDSENSDDDLSSIILLQDYYLPSHTLFVSMNHKIIDPNEVFKSNFANSLVYFNYPFLTNTILLRGLGIDNDRGVGWAYHYFVEGYNAMGLLGVFYNALFWNLCMFLWIRLTKSNNKKHNKSMVAILALIIALSVKGQTATFIKFYWLILLPALALLLLANNSKIAFFKRRRLSKT
tara:strand:- start:9480 stop:10817 length:1338 start_codon:yes stop_codon:yes gene_type:complete